MEKLDSEFEDMKKVLLSLNKKIEDLKEKLDGMERKLRKIEEKTQDCGSIPLDL